MIRFSLRQITRNRLPGWGVRNEVRFAFLTLGTFALTLLANWSVLAQCRMYSTGVSGVDINPCAYMVGTCSATGPGYTCTDGGPPLDEMCYKMISAVSPWNRCTFNTTAGSCAETMVSCGTVVHFPNVMSQPSCTAALQPQLGCQTTCVNATWGWRACAGP